MKKSPNNNCVANVENIGNHKKLVQVISGLKIYPNTAQKSNSESPREGSKRIIRKVDFSIVRDPNIPLDLKNCGENVCFFKYVIQVLYSLSIFRE